MASLDLKNGILTGIAILLVVCIVYQYDSTLFGLLGRRYDGFVGAPAAGMDMPTSITPGPPTVGPTLGPNDMAESAMGSDPEEKKEKAVSGFKNNKEGFADLASMEGPAAFASAEAPAGCYPRDQLTPTELLPADQNTIYAQQNPMGVGSLKGKNFLSAGALIGVNTVGQSLRNANLQLRSEPPNPQVPVSIFLQSTIGPDISHRPLEVGS
jgi:hypothetical protein